MGVAFGLSSEGKTQAAGGSEEGWHSRQRGLLVHSTETGGEALNCVRNSKEAKQQGQGNNGLSSPER